MRSPYVDWCWTLWAFGYTCGRRYSHLLGYAVVTRSLHIGPLALRWIGRAD